MIQRLTSIRFIRRERNYNFLSEDTCFNGSDLALAKSRVENPFELGFEYVDYQASAHLQFLPWSDLSAQNRNVTFVTCKCPSIGQYL